MTSSSSSAIIPWFFILFLLLCNSIATTISGSALPDIQSHRIIGAETSVYGPHYVRIIGYNRDYTRFNQGSGTFISLKHILTSASFMEDVNRVTIQYGSTDLDSLEERSYYATIISHPLYDAQTFEADLAVIVLPVPVEHGKEIYFQ